MSSRSAARGRAAASSMRLTSRTSKAVAISKASPSRCFLFCPGSRAARSAPTAAATVSIPPIPSLSRITAHPLQSHQGARTPGNLMGDKVEGGDDDAGEAPILVQETARELHRPPAACAPKDRFADKKHVLGTTDVKPEMLPVAQVHSGRGLRTSVGGPHHAFRVDDRDLNNDVAQHVGCVDDGAVVG